MNNLVPDGRVAGHLQPDISEFSLGSFDPSEPLPAYTSNWGSHLRRPDKLPSNYDTRIDPKHIFVFAVHPVTGIKRDFYVTPKPCEYCAKIRQVCSRSRPACQRCALSGDPDRVCHAEDGWTKLPGPKCEKPKLQKRASAALGSQSATPPGRPSPNSAPSLQRARTIAPQPSNVGFSSINSGPAPSTSNRHEPVKPPPRRVVPIPRSGNGNVASHSPSIPAMEPGANGTKKALTQKLAYDGRLGSRSGKKAATNGKGKQPVAGRWEGPDKTFWDVVRPSSSLSPSHTPKRPRMDNPSDRRPRIWAENKIELLEILPELSDAFGANGSGIYMDQSGLEPAMVLLEGHHWLQDSLDVDGSATISFVWDYTLETVRKRSDMGQSVDFGHDQNMTLVDDVQPQLRSESIIPLKRAYSEPLDVPRRNDVCHPSRSLYDRARQTPSSLAASTSQESKSQYLPTGVQPVPAKDSPLDHRPLSDRPFQSKDKQVPSSASLSPPRCAMGPPLSGVSPPHFVPTKSSISLHGAFGAGPTTIPQSNRQELAVLRLPSDVEAQLPAAFTSHRDTPDKVNPKLRPAAFTVTDLTDTGDAQDGEDFEMELGPSSPLKLPSSPLTDGYHDHLAPVQFSRNMDKFNRSLIGLLPETVPERAPLVRAQVDSEHISKSIPRELPPEIKHILNCQEYQIPIVLVASRDYAALSLTLPEDCGVCFLGFYKILDIESSQAMQREDETWHTSRVTWRLKLRWTPGGEDMPDDQQPPQPWWTAAAPTEPAEEPSPYSLLPMHMRTDLARPNEKDTVAYEVYTRKGWHCVQCGRLNVQRLLGVQACGTCRTKNDMLPVDVLYVRDPHKTMPDVTPIDTFPASVTHHVLDGEPGSTRTFVYRIDDGVEIKHVFTCNRPAVQEQAGRLFREIQVHVPMAWQEAKTRLATGPYYTFLAGIGHEPNVPATPWMHVPACVKEAREMMEMYAVKRAGEEGFKIDQLTILGWNSPGTRKSPPLLAENRPIAILCLGADVELTVTPVSGFASAHHPAVKRSESVVAQQAQRMVSRAADDDSPLSGASSDEEALSMRRSGVLSVPAAAVARTPKTKKPGETILVTLVHGDMVLFCGDDFEYALHRTGMSIVLIGMPQVSKGNGN